MAIRFLDMFAGIGGFRSGLELVGGFECVGHCEIDKHANQAYCAMYNIKPEEVYFDDATKINPDDLPDFDLICGGFPCQAFSTAGKRRGFDDARGTLFFEIARIAAVKKPKYILLENVPGLLSHDGGRTFATILVALDELGYDVAWQVLNSKDHGVPQARKRVYIICYFRDKCAGEVFSFTEANGTPLVQILPGSQTERVYSPRGLSLTLTSSGGGVGGKTGLYDVNAPLKIKCKGGYQLAYPGDAIDLSPLSPEWSKKRVKEKIAHTLTTTHRQGVYFIDMNPPPNLTENARCITARQDSGISNRKGEHSGVFIEEEPRAILNPTKEEVRQNGRRFKEPNEVMFTLTVCDRHGIIRYGRVRKLMPIECWRLQGFTDEQFYKAEATGLKDCHLYKMAGNAVTVNVVAAVGRKLRELDERVNKKE